MVTRITTLICIIASCAGCSSPPSASTIEINIAGEPFHLELMINQVSRTEGMMNRSTIPSDGGMLFVFPDSQVRSFWMKNCSIAIDLIYLDSRGTITSLHQMSIEPPQGPDESDWQYEGRLNHYWSKGPARFAIELVAGSINRLNLKVNDHISLELPYSKSIAR